MNCGKLFNNVAGRPRVIDRTRTTDRERIHMKRQTVSHRQNIAPFRVLNGLLRRILRKSQRFITPISPTQRVEMA